jgi:hypothetical protein
LFNNNNFFYIFTFSLRVPVEPKCSFIFSEKYKICNNEMRNLQKNSSSNKKMWSNSSIIPICFFECFYVRKLIKRNNCANKRKKSVNGPRVIKWKHQQGVCVCGFFEAFFYFSHNYHHYQSENISLFLIISLAHETQFWRSLHMRNEAHIMNFESHWRRFTTDQHACWMILKTWLLFSFWSAKMHTRG